MDVSLRGIRMHLHFPQGRGYFELLTGWGIDEGIFFAGCPDQPVREGVALQGQIRRVSSIKKSEGTIVGFVLKAGSPQFGQMGALPEAYPPNTELPRVRSLKCNCHLLPRLIMELSHEPQKGIYPNLRIFYS